ncbi:hypothetical protein J5N97_029521 [Dioscorea zingiberensis]|uniref:Uncharacterized protein n=1 Tax=Dioscorea zingiberensis TaxID=325984 RepID=A0A9D5H5Q7_9LILI|nr:hypothetical protein J5N97_029521 [Dioscorea zingiberensis]
MKAKTTNGMQRAQKLEYFRGDAPNWVLIVGGALLSTLSIRCGFKLKGVLDAKRANDATPDNRKFATDQRPGACRLHPNVYSISQNDGGCHRFLSGEEEKAGSTSPISKVQSNHKLSLSLVTIRSSDSSKENDVVPWASSPDRLDLPPRQFHHSNSSDSLCVSESGSDIHSKREVIQKLRRQLKLNG